MQRHEQRSMDQLRPVSFKTEVIEHAEGSVLISMGRTQVICTASIETAVPKWLSGTGKGWLSAEYGMLPRSTHTRMRRDKAANSGRTQEISRLIGRSLRAGLDFSLIPEKQILVDCDVIQADGGTRTAAVTGGFVALALAVKFGLEQSLLPENPIRHQVAAVSLGLKENEILLDLDYEEDFACDADVNVVMNHKGEFIEVQGTAENEPFSKSAMNNLLETAEKGCLELTALQRDCLRGVMDFSSIN